MCTCSVAIREPSKSNSSSNQSRSNFSAKIFSAVILYYTNYIIVFYQLIFSTNTHISAIFHTMPSGSFTNEWITNYEEVMRAPTGGFEGNPSPNNSPMPTMNYTPPGSTPQAPNVIPGIWQANDYSEKDRERGCFGEHSIQSLNERERDSRYLLSPASKSSPERGTHRKNE
eukprot:GHVU01224005.1.p1 GENE.GHVU01224005.1~~GHVU01224005.1.p1  ORF type:complete len:171 (-),score=11.20 GHVU01224005.1:177-689(-)